MHHRTTLAALSPLIFASLLLVACGNPSPDEAAVHSAASSTPSTFIKAGDNGAASCEAFCLGSQWGPTGNCEGVLINNIPCNQEIGYLANGTEETCTCVDGNGSQFVKHGDNGAASCADFCAGSQWGEVGTCVSGSISTNSTVKANGVSTAINNDCSLSPGFLNNGQMSCFCDNATCVKATCAQNVGFCGQQSDGCGGVIDCSNNCKSGETCDGSVCVPTCTPAQSGKSLCGGRCEISVTDSCGNITDCTCSNGLTCGENAICCTGLESCNTTDCGYKIDDCGSSYYCGLGCPSPDNPCQSVVGEPINQWGACPFGPLNGDGVCDDGQCVTGT